MPFTTLQNKTGAYRKAGIRREEKQKAALFLRKDFVMPVLPSRNCKTGKTKVSMNPAVTLAFGVVAFGLGVMVGFVSRVLAEVMGLKSVDGEEEVCRSITK